MLERLELTDDEREVLQGDREVLLQLADRLANVPTPAGPTPTQLGTDRAYIALTVVQDSINGQPGVRAATSWKHHQCTPEVRG